LLFTTYFENAATLALEKLLTKKIDQDRSFACIHDALIAKCKFK